MDPLSGDTTAGNTNNGKLAGCTGVVFIKVHAKRPCCSNAYIRWPPAMLKSMFLKHVGPYYLNCTVQ
jgi:hypothetical protein